MVPLRIVEGLGIVRAIWRPNSVVKTVAKVRSEGGV